jgi:predicted ester cyclase
MTIEDNKALFHRYQDALRNPEMLDSILAPDFVAYDQPEGRRDLASLKRFRERVNQLGPDQTVTEDYIVAEGDFVAAHITATQATRNGKRMSFSGIEIVGIKDGKISWRRGMLDDTGHVLRQRLRRAERVLSLLPEKWQEKIWERLSGNTRGRGNR